MPNPAVGISAESWLEHSFGSELNAEHTDFIYDSTSFGSSTRFPTAFYLENGAHDITIENVEIKGFRYGIRAVSGNNLAVGHVSLHDNMYNFLLGIKSVSGFTNANIQDVLTYSSRYDLTADNNTDGIVAEAYSTGLNISRVISWDHGDGGIDIKPVGANVSRVIVHHTWNGIKRWGANFTLSNCISYNNWGSALAMQGGTSDPSTINGPAYVYNCIFANNAIAKQAANGANRIIYAPVSNGNDFIFYNNIVYEPDMVGKDYIVRTSFSPPNKSLLDYNLWYVQAGNKVWGDASTSYTIEQFASGIGTLIGAGSIVADPNFVNPSSDDFHLQSISPAINRGKLISSVIEDLDAILRPQGSAYDIGAYETDTIPSQPCTLNSATITPNCAAGSSSDCETGETISLQGAYTGDCSSANFLQIDARNTSTSCVIEYSGQDMGGIFSAVTPNSGIVSGTWNIPAIPTICQGKIINAIYGVLWNGNPISGIRLNGTNAGGQFKFYSAAPLTCSDGTSYNSCSATKPLYCSAGILIDNCTTCGCNTGQSCNSTTKTCLAGKYKRIKISGKVRTSSGICSNCEITASFLSSTNITTTDLSGNFALTLEPLTEFDAKSYLINGTINKAGRIFLFRRVINVA